MGLKPTAKNRVLECRVEVRGPDLMLQVCSVVGGNRRSLEAWVRMLFRRSVDVVLILNRRIASFSQRRFQAPDDERGRVLDVGVEKFVYNMNTSMIIK